MRETLVGITISLGLVILFCAGDYFGIKEGKQLRIEQEKQCYKLVLDDVSKGIAENGDYKYEATLWEVLYKTTEFCLERTN